MKVEIVKTVVEEYELTEEDAIAIINDYDGDVKEYILNELDPDYEDETVEEVNYNIDELRSIEAKVKNMTARDWFIKYGSRVVECDSSILKGAVTPTEEQMELVELLMPFAHRYDSNYGDEFKGVRIFKDYAEASDLAVLVRVNVETELPDEIDFSLVGAAALEFNRENVLLCNGAYAVKSESGCLIPARVIDKPIDTHKKLSIDKNKGDCISLNNYNTYFELCKIDGNEFRSKYIDMIADAFGYEWKYYIDDRILKLYTDNIEIYLSAVIT